MHLGNTGLNKFFLVRFLVDCIVNLQDRHTGFLGHSQVTAKENRGKEAGEAGKGAQVNGLERVGPPHGLFRDISTLVSSG